MDIALTREMTLHGEPLYSFYLYNVKSHTFVYNEKYSALCCNMNIDTVKKEISIDYYDFINFNSEIRIYSMTLNEPVLNYYRTTSSLKFQGIDSVLIKEYMLIDGELKKVKEYKVKDEKGWE